MSETLERLLAEWRDPLGANTFSDAEDLIHMLMVELAGKDAVIEQLMTDIQYYKSVGQLLTAKLEKPPKSGDSEGLK